MRILLVNMPWHSVDYPSLALGILHNRVSTCQDPHFVEELHANLRWFEYLLKYEEIEPNTYSNIAEGGFSQGLGDWIFSSALNFDINYKVQEYTQYLRELDYDPALAIRLRTLTPDFIYNLASEIVDAKYDLIGFTSTFLQNIPSLALAKCLKKLQPDLKIIFGGGNCEGILGITLHRNFPFVDFVVRGEGEQAFVEVIDALNGHKKFEEIEGLCWRNSEGRPVINQERTHFIAIDNVPNPNYDSYFDEIYGSYLAEFIEPKLIVETARGCWWGAKHHCTFCGLNGSVMQFRSKNSNNVFLQVKDLIQKYQTLDLIMVDNIMDMGYFKSFLPRLIEEDWDVRIHYEVKSNLTVAQLKILRDARVVHIQPGIESLSSKVLNLMRKGVTGVQNIRVLREGEENGLSVAWNYLFGFPGEDDDDYINIIDQMPALVHLQAPEGAIRIELERYSPNFDDPALGFSRRVPSKHYSLIYELPYNELEDFSYFFDTVKAGITGQVEERLRNSVKEWSSLYFESSLTYRLVGNILYFTDRRANKPPVDIVIDTPWEVEAYLLLFKGLSKQSLERALIEKGHSMTTNLEIWLCQMKQKGLVFEDNQSYISIAIHENPRHVRIPFETLIKHL